MSLGIVRSLTGKVATLLGRMSATWAAQLDTLATRLSATWAAKLDTLAANFTSTIAGRIDAAISSRAAASNPLLSPPIASGLTRNGTALTSTQLDGAPFAECVTHSTTASTLSTAVTYTGAGVLNFCGEQHGSGAVYGSQLKITVDGVVVYDKTTTAGAYKWLCAVGALSPYYYWDGAAVKQRVIASLGHVPFESSLLIEHRSLGGSENTTCCYDVTKTG